jgi:small-conductance mechanosensitive channel
VSVFIVTVAALYLARRVFYRWLARHAVASRTRIDDLVLKATRLPSHFWVLCLGALVAVNVVQLPAEIEIVAYKGLTSMLILSFTIVTARFLAEFVQHYCAQWSPEFALATTGVTRTVVQAVVVLTGLLIMLSSLGIDVTPLLGALGVGGLAVGLALQPTLSNLFAGFQIAVVRQIRPGHRVTLDSGQEGYVSDISWRTTTLRTPSNHMIIVPNARLADSIVTNYDMPDRPVNIVLNLGVSYSADTRHVEAALADEARKLRDELPGMDRGFEPIIRFQSFGDFSLNFLVIVRMESFDAQFGVWGEIHHRIFARLSREGIEIPFPVRTVYLRDDHAGSVAQRAGSGGPR